MRAIILPGVKQREDAVADIRLKVRDVEVEFKGEVSMSLDGTLQFLEKMQEIAAALPPRQGESAMGGGFVDNG